MLCSKCGKRQASVHYKQIVNGKLTELYLCPQCANAMNAFGFDDFLPNLFGKVMKPQTEVPVTCGKCGMTITRLSKEGKLYHGCNVENSAYGPTNCAERTAFFTAVCAGDKEFSKIAIVGGMDDTDGSKPCAPCGVCRQVMSEFCDPKEFKIILANGEDEPLEYTLEEMLPLGFFVSNLR